MMIPAQSTEEWRHRERETDREIERERREIYKIHNIRSAYYKQFEYIHPGFINLTNQQKLKRPVTF